MGKLAKFGTKSYRDEKAQLILKWYHTARDERAEWLQNRLYYWNLYSGRVGRPSTPWPGASDIHVPLISKQVEAMLARYVQALFGAAPKVHVEPVEHGDVEESDDQEVFLNWCLENEVRNFYKEMQHWIRMTLIDGTGVVKTNWEKTWRKTRQKYRISRWLYPGDTIAGVTNTTEDRLELKDEDFIDHLIDVKENISPKGEHIFTCKSREGDRWLDTEIEIIWPDSDDVDTVEIYVSKDNLVYDAPIIKTLNLEDLYLPFRASDCQTCQYAIHEVWLTLDELTRRREEGIYNFTDRDWKDLVKLKDSGGVLSPGEDSPRKEELDIQEGITTSPYFKDGRFVVLETYCYDDIDNDYRDEHMVYAAVPAVNTIARWQYLEEEFAHGHRPLASIDFVPVVDRFYGKGIPEILASLQVEANTIINLMNDRENLINNPFFFYVPAPGADPNQYLSIRPGEGIPIADGNAVVFPNWGKAPFAGAEMLQLIFQLAEELIGIGPTQTGQRRPGSLPRTARGTFALISESNIKVDAHIKVAQEQGFKELFHQIFALYQDMMPEEKWFHVMSEARPRKITKESTRGRWNFYLTGNTANTNREAQQNKATILYQTLAAEPLMMQDLAARRELLRNFLRNYNDGDLNLKDLLPNVPAPLRARSPEEVIALLAQGIRVEPRQGEDPQVMSQAILQFTKQMEFESVPKQYVPLFVEAVQAYQTFGAMQAQMQTMRGRTPETAFQPGGNGSNPPGTQAPLAPLGTEGMMSQSR